VTGTPFRSEKFVVRNWMKVKGVLKEIQLLKKLKRENKLDCAILSVNGIIAVMYYFFLSKLIGFRTILNHVEFYSAMQRDEFKIGRKINNLLYDNYSFRLVDGVFPISEFLIKRMQKRAPRKKFLKIPVLTDLERYRECCEANQTEQYFLFCGAAGYHQIIEFIVDCFDCLTDTPAYLYLVTNGDKKELENIQNYINKAKLRNQVKMFSKLTNSQLSNLYKNAIALLIPLRPTLQDKARFPHKIGEYMASGNPVISTNYGEVKHYFRDMFDMLIADSYDKKLFAEKMQFILNQPEEARKIGANGKETASKYFDYRSYGPKIINFIDSLDEQVVLRGKETFNKI
jgi:glycosyltransferase involved in cell wall biosynthesis